MISEKKIFNIHKYLDGTGPGLYYDCTTNNIKSSFYPLSQWLRLNNRKAILTETGGGPNSQSCLQYLCEQNDFINANSDVFLGVLGWGAGGFDTKWGYNLTETPIETEYGYEDQRLVKDCIIGKFKGAKGMGKYVT